MALAGEAIDTDTVKEPDRVYTCLILLEAARRKGFGVADALALLAERRSVGFRCAVLEWLAGKGVKGIAPEEALGLVPVMDRLLTDPGSDLSGRLAAHGVCRQLVWRVRSALKGEPGGPAITEGARAKASDAIRVHIDTVCRIVADPDETDAAVQAFGGYLGYYYRNYAMEGLYDKAALRSAVEKALGQKRGRECSDALQSVLSKGLTDEP